MTVSKEGIDPQILLKKLKAFSADMEKSGSLYALYGVKEAIGIYEYDLVEVSRQMKEPERFSAIWLLQSFINELWCNLGGDTTGFPKERGTPYIVEISKHLGQFIQESFFREGKPMETLTKVIKAYFGLLRLVEEDLQEGRSFGEEWCVL